MLCCFCMVGMIYFSCIVYVVVNTNCVGKWIIGYETHCIPFQIFSIEFWNILQSYNRNYVIFLSKTQDCWVQSKSLFTYIANILGNFPMYCVNKVNYILSNIILAYDTMNVNNQDIYFGFLLRPRK